MRRALALGLLLSLLAQPVLACTVDVDPWATPRDVYNRERGRQATLAYLADVIYLARVSRAEARSQKAIATPVVGLKSSGRLPPTIALQGTCGGWRVGQTVIVFAMRSDLGRWRLLSQITPGEVVDPWLVDLLQEAAARLKPGSAKAAEPPK